MSKRLTARQIVLRSISETDWQERVETESALLGWWSWHDNDPRRNRSGWPDLVLVRPPRILFVELKTENGRLSSRQRVVLGMLARCPGVEVYVWRPSDEDDVRRILT